MRLPWHRRPDTPGGAHPPAPDDAGPTTHRAEDDSPTDDLDQQRRNTTTVAAYGRLLTDAHAPQDPTTDPTGAVHVCGIGLIPIAVALAAVPVDDARHRLLMDPDNQAARHDEATALAYLHHVTDEAAAATTPPEPGTAPTPR